jgi:hypothetical protein
VTIVIDGSGLLLLEIRITPSGSGLGFDSSGATLKFLKRSEPELLNVVIRRIHG